MTDYRGYCDKLTADTVDVDFSEMTEKEENRAFCKALAFLAGGVEGGPASGAAMLRGVFRLALDLLMPFWDPLRHSGLQGGDAHPSEEAQQQQQ